jgi:gliding motility-associated protein GldE
MIAVAGVCLILSAFVSGSEIAYFGLSHKDRDDLDEEDTPVARKVLALLANPEQLLATILITNNLVNITTVVVLTFAINQVAEFHSTALNFLVQTVFLTFLLLLFGEIFPKLVARSHTLKWVKFASGGVTSLNNLFRPIARMMVKSGRIVNKVVTKKEENISTDELEKALEISDVTDENDKEMLEGILQFGEKEAREVMISRVDITDLECHASWDEAMKVILDSGYSRIPVYDTTQDSICGVLYSKDLLPYIGKEERPAWQSLLREAYFVPESRMLDDLLEDFRKKKIHIAIVIDEYGCTQGIVTLEDVIEQIVGDIDDEYDEAHIDYRKVSADTWIFRGNVTLDDFCHVLNIEEEELGDVGDAETIAGLMLEIKGDFPDTREQLKRGPVSLQAIKMEKHRIMKIKATLDGAHILETPDSAGH